MAISAYTMITSGDFSMVIRIAIRNEILGVTREVTRDVCFLARMMAANLYFSQIEDLMFEVSSSQTYV
ncbi:Phosphoenolpyruvate carboxylase 1 [Platanthera zijinensis]|uniref:Phosphoenolpyruvate carboxylase 1 n=1 Tax=Platanthera zijinensis TaxID=2320716 RepID=A0AAP0B2J4_9ASPA